MDNRRQIKGISTITDKMFISVKKKTILVTLAAALCLIATAVLCVEIATAQTVPKLGYTVVIDAGHGGFDGGVSGSQTGTKEADLNLEVAKELKKFLNGVGVDVVMTRTNGDGLYGVATQNRKQRDMQARTKIINDSKADLVISIHMNYFPQQKQRGAQVFYRPKSEESKEFALSVRSILSANLSYCDRLALEGDYYILNCTDKPAVLVECGFLSNPEEEMLLCDKDYRQKLAYCIMLGTLKYLNVDFKHLNLV